MNMTENCACVCACECVSKFPWEGTSLFSTSSHLSTNELSFVSAGVFSPFWRADHGICHHLREEEQDLAHVHFTSLARDPPVSPQPLVKSRANEILHVQLPFSTDPLATACLVVAVSCLD